MKDKVCMKARESTRDLIILRFMKLVLDGFSWYNFNTFFFSSYSVSKLFFRLLLKCPLLVFKAINLQGFDLLLLFCPYWTDLLWQVMADVSWKTVRTSFCAALQLYPVA